MNDYGLKKLPPDPRDLRFGSLFSLPLPSDLPDEYMVAPYLTIRNQYATDYCAAEASTSVSEDQEGVTLDPLWQFMKAKQLDGKPTEWGTDLRTIAQTFVKFGSIDSIYSPYTISTPRETIVNPASWTDKPYDTLAPLHLKASFAFVGGGRDFFDDIRCALWYGRTNKQSAVLGTGWCQEWLGAPGGVISKMGTNPSGHAIKISGWKQIDGAPYLVAQLSSGTTVGDRGFFYLSRDIVNAEEGYGAFVFTPYDKEYLAIHQEANVKADKIWIIRQALFLLNTLKNYLMDHPNAQPTDEVTVSIQPSIYDWDTPILARHSVRVICDEEGLSVEDKNELCATVGAESGWMPGAIGKPNTNGTRDWGIVQMNDGLWIGPGKLFPSTDYVLTHPEECVRWMCKQWKAGHRDWWAAHSSGAFKRYL